ncbi:MAG: 4'-phosphopantetheinyl transferase superfamily protein [Myxococcales bacterium]|nr:MAG: 4'-phosphopantetheinyl transferase superfamily protein [Myxococcales bacterium]
MKKISLSLTDEIKNQFINTKQIHVWIINCSEKSVNKNKKILSIIKKYLTSYDFSLEKKTNGKPYIKSSHDRELYISISHSYDVLVVALSFAEPIGVDVEFVKEREFIKRISDKYFIEPIVSLMDFYRSWTARESFVKINGNGLMVSMKKIKVDNQAKEFLIGIKDYSHKVVFHSFENYLIATCLENSEKNSVQYFWC